MTADTLTQLILKVQAQLLDNATQFTTATCTAAIRQALHEINRQVPTNEAELITAIADQKEYELSDAPLATRIFDVLLDGANEYDVSLDYDAYSEDSRLFFRLRQPQAAGETLIVRYTKPYTISGLDSATDSTLTPDLNDACISGACFYACLVRAAYTAEANNVEPSPSASWSKLATIWQDIFINALRDYKRQNTPVGEPDASRRAWNDEWHTWNT